MPEPPATAARRARPGRRGPLALVFFLLIPFLPRHGAAQDVADSLARAHSPLKATLLSTVLPGAGQFYNRKYWKIPVIYGAFCGLGYLVKFNNDRFQDYKHAYILRSDGNPETVDAYDGIYSDGDLKDLREFYRRNRDLSIIFAGLVYVMNIVDASVDAHLFYFDVSDDLSLQVAPLVAPGDGPAPVTGLRCMLSF